MNLRMRNNVWPNFPILTGTKTRLAFQPKREIEQRLFKCLLGFRGRNVRSKRKNGNEKSFERRG
jgi:hypothetical protein